MADEGIGEDGAMNKKKWMQEQIVDAAGKVHKRVMARVDRRFPSQDSLIAAHNWNAVDLQCELNEAQQIIEQYPNMVRNILSSKSVRNVQELEAHAESWLSRNRED